MESKRDLYKQRSRNGQATRESRARLKEKESKSGREALLLAKRRIPLSALQEETKWKAAGNASVSESEGEREREREREKEKEREGEGGRERGRGRERMNVDLQEVQYPYLSLLSISQVKSCWRLKKVKLGSRNFLSGRKYEKR